MLACKVNGHSVDLMVDCGARFSTLTANISKQQLSHSSVAVLGFSGKTENLPFTEPLKTVVGSQTFYHQYLYAPTCPVNLMGRDMLQKLGAEILCGPDGLTVCLPDGTELHCNDKTVFTSSQIT